MKIKMLLGTVSDLCIELEVGKTYEVGKQVGEHFAANLIRLSFAIPLHEDEKPEPADPTKAKKGK